MCLKLYLYNYIISYLFSLFSLGYISHCSSLKGPLLSEKDKLSDGLKVKLSMTLLSGEMIVSLFVVSIQQPEYIIEEKLWPYFFQSYFSYIYITLAS